LDYMAKLTSKRFNWKKAALALGAVGIIAGSATVVKRVVDPREIVTEVIDGDTFRISNRQTIRFYAVDAPELGNCYGEDARVALTKKILGKKVTIKSPRTDYYRRVQAFVYLDGEFINEYMVKNGFASEHGDGTPETDIVKEANTYAKENKLGIYSENCSPSVPKNKVCNIKGNVTYDGGKKEYTLPGCHNYIQTIVERFRGEDWFCSEEEAKAAGFTKAPICSK
jgi:endonuclease YncB( thermonuclease family)